MLRRSLLLHAPERLVWLEDETDSPGPGEALVATRLGSISVGSELAAYRGKSPAVDNYPLMTGYENVATVVEVGPDVGNVRPGDRVVASYGHSSHATLRAEKLVQVAPEVPDNLALLSILLCDVARGVKKLRPGPEEPVLVAGAGAIGLLSVFYLKACGVRNVDVIEPEKNRRELAIGLGAAAAVSSEEAASLRPKYGAALECSAEPEAFEALQSRMSPEGRICVLSDARLRPLTLSPTFHERELTVFGCSDGRDHAALARWYFDLLGRSPTLWDALRSLFSLCVDFKELPQTFRELASEKTSVVKVLVRYRRSG